jgi:hypothetical protein
MLEQLSVLEQLSGLERLSVPVPQHRIVLATLLAWSNLTRQRVREEKMLLDAKLSFHSYCLRDSQSSPRNIHQRLLKMNIR